VRVRAGLVGQYQHPAGPEVQIEVIHVLLIERREVIQYRTCGADFNQAISVAGPAVLASKPPLPVTK